MSVITVREYSAFCVKGKGGSSPQGYCALKESAFLLLERFLLENAAEGEDGATDVMGLSVRRGVGKVITVKSYVGVIALNDGTVIEILPKICGTEDGSDTETARRLLVRMLNTLYRISHKSLQEAELAVCRMNVLEVFIRLFADEVMRLTKMGLQSGYESLEGNLTCAKGKLLFAKQLQHNLAHKERIYAAYDEFTVNRPENRILKAALIYLSSLTRSARTQKDLKRLLALFEGVTPSVNYDADFARIAPDRNTKAYETALRWAQVFLKKKSFTSFSGSSAAMALLFPMEKLFESYIPALMRELLAGTGATLSTQDKGYHLFDTPACFALRPDIVLAHQGEVFIMDTKWKRLSGDAALYGISQADMYQMYAYYQKYNAAQAVKSVTLLYPKPQDDIKPLSFADATTGATVNIRFIDMREERKSLAELLKEYGLLPAVASMS